MSGVREKGSSCVLQVREQLLPQRVHVTWIPDCPQGTCLDVSTIRNPMVEGISRFLHGSEWRVSEHPYQTSIMILYIII